MRRGQSRGRAADLLPDSTGRLLVTVQTAAVIEQRHVNVVRRVAVQVGHVACDVRTGALLYDAIALGKELRKVSRGPERARGAGGKFVTHENRYGTCA